MYTIGLALLGAFIGLVIGAWIGERQGGDFNIAPVIYGPIGACVGGFLGVVAGVVFFGS